MPVFARLPHFLRLNSSNKLNVLKDDCDLNLNGPRPMPTPLFSQTVGLPEATTSPSADSLM